MAGQDGLVVDLNDVAAFPADGSNAKPKTAEGQKPQDDHSSAEEMNGRTDEDEEEEEEEMTRSAHLEPATLPWPGDKDKKLLLNQEDSVSGPEERDTGISQGGSQDLSEERSQGEDDLRRKAKWRESMPEGERWRDDEIELQRSDKGDGGSLADDEDDDEEEEEDKEWMSEKPSMGFTPHVTIVCPTTKELPEESRHLGEQEEDAERELQMEHDPAAQFYPGWEDQDDTYCECPRPTGLQTYRETNICISD